MTLMDKSSTNAAWHYLEDCYDQEQQYKQLLLDGLTIYSNMDTFNDLNDKYEGNRMCDTLSQHFEKTDGVRARNVTLSKC